MPEHCATNKQKEDHGQKVDNSLVNSKTCSSLICFFHDLKQAGLEEEEDGDDDWAIGLKRNLDFIHNSL